MNGGDAVAPKEENGVMTVRTAKFAAALALVLAISAGCETDPQTNTPGAAGSTTSPAVPAEPSSPATDPAPTSPGATPPTETAKPSASPPASAAPPTESSPGPKPPSRPKPAKLKRGASGPKVLALQRRLDELGYWIGTADGNYGMVTQQAVYALQKAAGLGRDGVVGPKTQRALDKGTRPKAKSKKGRVVEINLKRQLLMVVDGGKVVRIFNTATGSNQHYVYEGERHLAVTPKGRFKVGRQINAWRYGPLGALYRPKYFNGGIALHGAYSVPPYPASHGCARLSVPAMDWIWKHGDVPVGTAVWVY